MPSSQDKLERLEAFIKKQRELAEADGDRRRSRTNTYNATADVLLEEGYFDAEETPSKGHSPLLSVTVDSRIARLNSTEALDALERIEARAVAASKAAARTERLVYLFAGPLFVAIGFILFRLG